MSMLIHIFAHHYQQPSPKKINIDDIDKPCAHCYRSHLNLRFFLGFPNKFNKFRFQSRQ